MTWTDVLNLLHETNRKLEKLDYPYFIHHEPVDASLLDYAAGMRISTYRKGQLSSTPHYVASALDPSGAAYIVQCLHTEALETKLAQKTLDTPAPQKSEWRFSVELRVSAAPHMNADWDYIDETLDVSSHLTPSQLFEILNDLADKEFIDDEGARRMMTHALEIVEGAQ